MSKLALPTEEVPINVFIEVTELGPLAEVLSRIEEFRKSKVTFILRDPNRENCIAAQMLASLGVAAGVNMLSGPVDWDACSDLAHYTFYVKPRRAAIEPFNFMMKSYRRNHNAHMGTSF
jgi:hypothetical protein